MFEVRTFRIGARNIFEKVFCTRYCHYEILLMPVGLINASATFYGMMNEMFQKHWDKFVIFIDGVFVHLKI